MEEDNLGAGRLEAINRGSDGGEQLADLDLLRLLGEQLLVDQSALLNRLMPLLEPSEVQRLALRHPLLQLRGATAALERQRSVKRCRHLLAAWSGQRLETLERCIARLLEQEAGGVEGSTGLDGPEAASAASIDPLADMEQRIEALFAELNGDALRFQQLYYAERRYLEDLDKRRRTGYEEVLAQPAI